MSKDIGLIIAKVLAFITSLFLIFLIALPMFMPKDNEKEFEDKIPSEEKNPENNVENDPIEQPLVEVKLLENLVPNNGDTIESGNGRLVNLGQYGIRYQGLNPNNYIYFNCNDYNDQNNETCELWRIIGRVDGKVKLIKNESIGQYIWNTAKTNNWNESSLNNYLNNQYLTEITTKNPMTEEMIVASTWYLKGPHTSDVVKTEIYDLERTTGNVYANNPETLTNTKIGLMYPSDYGFAALETDTCLPTTTLFKYVQCVESNWIAQNQTSDWFISNWSENGTNSFVSVNNTVGVRSVHNQLNVRPVLYLIDEIELEGEGTLLKPFEIIVK